MQRQTKATLWLTMWSFSSGAGVLFFADMLDRGGHPNLATAGIVANGIQLGVAVIGLMVQALS